MKTRSARRRTGERTALRFAPLRLLALLGAAIALGAIASSVAGPVAGTPARQEMPLERSVVADGDGALAIVLDGTLRPVSPPAATNLLLATLLPDEAVGGVLPGIPTVDGELIADQIGRLWWVAGGTRRPVEPLPLDGDVALLPAGDPLDLSGAEDRIASAVVATPTPAPNGTPTRTPGPTPTALPGTVLLADNFDDPAVGILPKSSISPRTQDQGYVGGRYVLKKLDLSPDSGPVSLPLPGTYDDASLTVDVLFESGGGLAYARLGCRQHFENGLYGYMIDLFQSGEFFFTRMEANRGTALPAWRGKVQLRAGAPNQVALSCVRDTIAAQINGAQVVSIQDTVSRAGTTYLAMGTGITAATPVSVWFDNLLLIKR